MSVDPDERARVIASTDQAMAAIFDAPEIFDDLHAAVEKTGAELVALGIDPIVAASSIVSFIVGGMLDGASGQ